MAVFIGYLTVVIILLAEPSWSAPTVGCSCKEKPAVCPVKKETTCASGAASCCEDQYLSVEEEKKTKKDLKANVNKINKEEDEKYNKSTEFSKEKNCTNVFVDDYQLNTTETKIDETSNNAYVNKGCTKVYECRFCNVTKKSDMMDQCCGDAVMTFIWNCDFGCTKIDKKANITDSDKWIDELSLSSCQSDLEFEETEKKERNVETKENKLGIEYEEKENKKASMDYEKKNQAECLYADTTTTTEYDNANPAKPKDCGCNKKEKCNGDKPCAIK